VSAPRPAAVIVLAAGEGTRMKSTGIPKVLNQICGKSMLGHCLAAAQELDPERLIVVVGHHGEIVADHTRELAPEVIIAVQDYRGGTGHAVRVALETVGLMSGTIVVTYADAPLLRGVTLAGLVRARDTSAAAAAILTTRPADPTGYGRIIRDDSGKFTGIVEQADATAAQRAIDEINSGMYAFDGDLLFDAVKRIGSNNAQGEEYLTDGVCVLADDGYPVVTVECPDPDEVQGVNDLAQLAMVSRLMETGRYQGSE
jgi:bifunctional UDP-N-acetylglucosamine pyrophosphorylase / glucosamine-1-phosphate N-acetyltransferase